MDRRQDRRLGCKASILASVHGAIRLGLDQDLCCQLARVGLEEDAVTVIRFRGLEIEYSVILPTCRTWKQARLRGLAFEVDRRVQTDGHHVLVVPPADVQRKPRFANAHYVFHEKLVPACGDVHAVTRCIKQFGGEAPLDACQAALSGPLGRRRIFGLLLGGHIEIDLAFELPDRSIVRLREQCWAFDWAVLGWRLLGLEQEDQIIPAEAAGFHPNWRKRRTYVNHRGPLPSSRPRLDGDRHGGRR